MSGRDPAPASAVGAGDRSGLGDQAEGYRRAARIYRDEVDGRLRALAARWCWSVRGELGRAEADELIDKLVTRADQWMRVYEAERGLAS